MYKNETILKASKNKRPISNHISFVGHYDIGEKLSQKTINLIKMSLDNGDKNFIVLVGDIAVKEKMELFYQKGYQGIKESYLNRLRCAKSKCNLSQLPKNDEEIHQLIDIKTFEKGIKILKQHCGELFFEAPNYSTIIQDKVIPTLIEERINSYNLSAHCLLVLSERKLRNMASIRLRSKSNKTWRNISSIRINNNGVFLGNQQLTTENRVPMCRAITFMMNEYLASHNYHSIDYYLEKRHYQSLFLGWINYEKHQTQLSYMKSKITKVNFKII